MYKKSTKDANQNERMFSMSPMITELWQQDYQDQDLWHNEQGIMINTAALVEREAYFDIIRVPASALSISNDLDSFIFEHH